MVDQKVFQTAHKTAGRLEHWKADQMVRRKVSMMVGQMAVPMVYN